MVALALTDSGSNAMRSSLEPSFLCGMPLRWTLQPMGKRCLQRSSIWRTPRSRWWALNSFDVFGKWLTFAALDRDLANKGSASAATEKRAEFVLCRSKPIPPALQLIQLPDSMGGGDPASNVRTLVAL